jgi:chloramphenicol O-acetyltransferase type A
MPEYLDIEAWERREHFNFFRDYEQPFFSVCAEVDVTELARVTAGPDYSFFLASLFLSQKAVNETEEFRYRITGDRILIHERVRAGSTVLRDDGTFAFGYFPDRPSFPDFQAEGQAVIEKVRRPDLPLEPEEGNDDLVYYSVLPWIRFTSFAHARRKSSTHCIPKIVFGKRVMESGSSRMPVSVEVHHAVMDGIHVGKYYERLQQHLDQAADVLSLDVSRHDEATAGGR